jgi:hypothetical protein
MCTNVLEEPNYIVSTPEDHDVSTALAAEDCHPVDIQCRMYATLINLEVMNS